MSRTLAPQVDVKYLVSAEKLSFSVLIVISFYVFMIKLNIMSIHFSDRIKLSDFCRYAIASVSFTRWSCSYVWISMGQADVHMLI